MIRSMTGFGAAEGDVGRLRVTAEVRAVNHRFFNPSIKLPGVFARWEADVRESLRGAVARGHVTLMVRVDRSETREGTIDEARFAAYVEQLRALEARHGLDGGIDVATVLRLPDVITTGASVEPDEPAEADGPQLLAVVDRAITALNAMRSAEGARLQEYLLQRLRLIEAAVGRIAERAPGRLVEQRDRLRTNVQELAQGVALDEARLAQEIAILADRLDVAEEIARFRSHFVAFHDALASGDGIGKKLGFLLQELLREANTTGSKANDAAILQDVLLIKEELERIREQVENLE